MKRILFLILLYIGMIPDGVYAQENISLYMKTQALFWEQLPMQWNEGAFLGNGRVGMMVYADSVDNSLTLWLGRPDVTDHRKASGKKTSLGVEKASVMTDYCRMDVGKMKLYPDAKILSGTMELDIFKAELTGTVHTDKGDFKILAYTPYGLDLNIVEVESSVPYQWKMVSGSSSSPRIQVFPSLKKKLKYISNPEPQLVNKKHEGYCVYPLLAGGDYAVYWKEDTCKMGSTLYVSVENEVPVSFRSLSEAQKTVNHAMNKGSERLRNEMHEWWSRYYLTGMIDIPDKQMENFYHIQLYKLATCSSPDGPVMDCMGTFYKTTQWPGIWWNLNVQLTYMSTHATNRLQQGQNFQKLIDRELLNVVKARGSAKCGDFVWVLHTYYSYMRYAGISWKEIADKFIPKAEPILAIYRSHLKKDGGIYHLLSTESPEYEGFKVYDNSNYNLAALKWLLQTTLDLCKLSSSCIQEQAYWEDVFQNLHSAPVNENGYMIASNQALNKSHRHYSHLLSFYPLRIQNVSDKQVREQLYKSLEYWLTIDKGRKLAGYSYTGAASLYALLGDGDKAYAQLHHFLTRSLGVGILLPNTMYVESSGKNPVIETPLSAATAITEMLLQGWGNVLRVFPAIPDGWKTCSFNKLRAEGGWIVSASREEGKLKWVSISSESEEHSCKIYLPEWKKVYVVEGKKNCVKKLEGGYYVLNIEKGNTVILAGSKGEISYSERSIDNFRKNYYGVKKGKGLKRQMDWNIDKNSSQDKNINTQYMLN